MHCGKKFFRDKKTAKKKKKQFEAKYGQKYEIYKCPDCWNLHLTSKQDAIKKEYYRTINKWTQEKK